MKLSLANNDLNIILKGTIVSKSNSYCLIKYNDSDKFTLLKKGENFNKRYIVYSINDKYIILTDNYKNKKYTLYLGYSLNIDSENRVNTENNKIIFKNRKNITKKRFTVKQTLLKKYANNPTEILYSASAIPSYEGKALVGYKIKNIKQGSLIEKFGIMNGDIILKVNGIPTTDINSILSLYGRINSIKSYSILIKRNGKIMNLYYEVKD